MSAPEVRVLADADAVAVEAAARIAASIADGPARVALAGGSTPRAAYAHLARQDLEWSRLHLFFGDERCVPPDDPGSNYRMVRDALLDHVAIPAANVHRIPGERPPPQAAAAAADDLRATFGDGVPRFDLILLGIGEDGHTASLFPDGPETEVTDRTTVEVHRPALPQPWRVSLTLPVLNAARQVVFLATGEAKVAAVYRAIAGDQAIPAGRVSPEDGQVTWLIDAELASAIDL